MLIYYDAEGMVTFSVSNKLGAPAGDYLEIPEGTKLGPLSSYKVIDGELVQIDILPVQEEAINEINGICNQIRQMFITPITGQDLIYKEKENEARDYLLSDPEPIDLTDFPFIAAEVGATAPTAHDVAQVYVNLAAQWRVVGSQLEQLRIGSITGVEYATSVPEIEGILDNFNLYIGAYL